MGSKILHWPSHRISAGQRGLEFYCPRLLDCDRLVSPCLPPQVWPFLLTFPDRPTAVSASRLGGYTGRRDISLIYGAVSIGPARHLASMPSSAPNADLSCPPLPHRHGTWIPSYPSGFDSRPNKSTAPFPTVSCQGSFFYVAKAGTTNAGYCQPKSPPVPL
ncbi:hypothetical protein LZ30DRAFT_715766 [Colletotrichum cereale]|nr:hypothetical protein LZ30DRAFT_715766 [Colletotrichum cereale]